MKRLTIFLLAIVIISALCSCGTAGPASPAPTPTASPAPTEPPEPTEPPVPVAAPDPAPDWAEGYLSFLEDNYDILAALWPEGLTGVGFIDLDLDGTPEMVLFDQGASATMGAQLFDRIDGRVYCVSSTNDRARGAFDDTYLSPMTICTSFFVSFRLSETAEGRCFWVSSENGTTETSWDELIRFGREGDALTLTSVCTRWVKVDPETGAAEERYTVAGAEAEADAYRAAAAGYAEAEDTGYEARGVFLWTDLQQRYDITYEGLMAMARDAVTAYVPPETN